MLPTTHDKGGYDASFISEVPEDLICMICQLVVCNPKQISCGHCFCSTCFDGLATHSAITNSELVCPIDGHLINLDDVFKDNAAARRVRNLEVKCKGHESGCSWTGCLGDMDSHESGCQYLKQADSNVEEVDSNDDAVLYKDVLQSLTKCQEDNSQKEKQLSYLQSAVKEFKEDMSKTKCDLQELQDANSELKSKVICLNLENEKVTKDLRSQIEILHKKCTPSSSTWNNFLNFVIAFVAYVAVNNLTGSGYGDVVSGGDGNAVVKKIADLEDHVSNVENVLYLHNFIRSRKVRFKWILQNYQYHFDKGVTVSSPIFYSQVLGYRLQLLGQWKGLDKEKFHISFSLSRGKRGDELISNLPDFNLQFNFAVLHKSGEWKIWNIEVADLHNLKGCFSIPDDSDSAKLQCGVSFLNSPYDDYVIDGTAYITCSISLKDHFGNYPKPRNFGRFHND